MASVIEDVSSLPGETVNDQDGRKVGEVKEIYGVGENETPMWVTVEVSTGIGRSRLVFIPIARLKQDGGEIRVPYSLQHIEEAPEVEVSDELSEEDDQSLRNYYAIGLADQEMVDSAQSYASQVPDEKEPARKIDASSAEGQVRELEDKPPEERAAEAEEALDKERSDEDDKEGRKATAEDVLDDQGPSEGKDEDKDEGPSGKEEDKAEGKDEGPSGKEESQEEAKGEAQDEGKDDDKEQDKDESKGEERSEDGNE